MYWVIVLDVINVARRFVDSSTDLDQDASFWVVENRNVETVRFLLERASDRFRSQKLRVYFSSININLEDEF